MDQASEICNMENQKQFQFVPWGVIARIMVGLFTLCTVLMWHYELEVPNMELILSPLIVVAMLAFGDQLLLMLLIRPISLVSKGIQMLRGAAKAQQSSARAIVDERNPRRMHY